MQPNASSEQSFHRGADRGPAPPLAARNQFRRNAHAIIVQSGRSVTTSGQAGSTVWKLRFERRSAPYIEPLMGWTGDYEPLSQIELCFPTAGSAIEYARQQGLPYTLWLVQDAAGSDCYQRKDGRERSCQNMARTQPQVWCAARRLRPCGSFVADPIPPR